MVTSAPPKGIASKSEEPVGESNRRYERFPVNLKATLIRGRKSATGRVVDVSFTGLFFTTVEPPPLRDLVKIDLVLPTGGETRLLGMAVHVVRASLNSKRRPGVGVQLFGIGPDVRAEWDKFVASVRKAHLKAVEEDERPDPNHTGDLATRPTPHESIAEAKASGRRVEESDPYGPSESTTAPPDELTLEPQPEDAQPRTEPMGRADPAGQSAPGGPSKAETSTGAEMSAEPEDAPKAILSLRPDLAAEPESKTSPAQDAVREPQAATTAPSSVASAGADEPQQLSADELPTSGDVEDAFEFLQSPGPEGPDVEAGPGDVAPGPSDAFDIDRLFEVAKPELRVHVGSPEEIEPLRRRQAAGEHLFFRTEVHMSPGTELQVRVLLPEGETAFIAEGRVVESDRTSDTTGLSVLLHADDAAPSEDIYITIDLDNDWLQGTT